MDNNNENNNNNNNNKNPKNRQTWFIVLVATLVMFLVLTYMRSIFNNATNQKITYDEFIEKVEDGQVETVARIRRDLENALAEGAIGVSLGIGYMPLFLYSKEEILSCLEPIRNSSVPVTVHMRQEGDGMLTALQETISIAKELNAPFEISHLKAIGKRSWQKMMPQALTILHRALEEGVQLGWDIYPYTAGSTQLAHVLPPEVWGKEKLILNDRLQDLYALEN